MRIQTRRRCKASLANNVATSTNRINGFDILRINIYEPRAGIWHADVQVDAGVELEDPITIELEGGLITFVGSIFRGGLEAGRWLGRLIGGANGMATDVAAKHYKNASFSTILTDLMNASGETLSSDTPLSVTSHQQARWQRSSGKVSHAISHMVDILNAAPGDPGYVWRIQRNGELLITIDTFPELEFANQELDKKPSLGEVLIAPLSASDLLPGATFNGDRVDYVLTEIVPGSIRQRYWTTDASDG